MKWLRNAMSAAAAHVLAVCCLSTTAMAQAPTGACCITAAGGVVCSVRTEASCAADHGVWRGVNTTCGNTTCQVTTDPVGACCTGATCQLRNQSSCASGGGVWRGPNTNCEPAICGTTAPTGACCVQTPNGVNCII